MATRSFYVYCQRENSSLSTPVELGLICSTANESYTEGRTFNICSNVVLPALSRPRKRSLACLLRSPREARTSQTTAANKESALVSQVGRRERGSRPSNRSKKKLGGSLHQLTMNMLKDHERSSGIYRECRTVWASEVRSGRAEYGW